MRLRLIAANLSAAIVTAWPAQSARAMQAERSTDPSESRIPVGNASLYARVIGRGQPVMHDTWEVPGYDLPPQLRNLRMPTLVITGDHDFIPVEVAEHIAQAIPNALDDFFSSVRPDADRH